jgi:hypothetical protein
MNVRCRLRGIKHSEKSKEYREIMRMHRGRALWLALLSTLAITGSVPRTEAASAAAIEADVDVMLLAKAGSWGKKRSG